MNKKIGPLLFLLILMAGIPVTVFLSLQPQDIRGRASSETVDLQLGNYGTIDQSFGIEVPNTLDNRITSNILFPFPRGGIYLKVKDPGTSLFNPNFDQLSANNFSWYFTFSAQTDAATIASVVDTALQKIGNKTLVVELEDYKNVSLITNLKNKYQNKIKINTTALSQWYNRGAIGNTIRSYPPNTIDVTTYQTPSYELSQIFDKVRVMVDTFYDLSYDVGPSGPNITYPAGWKNGVVIDSGTDTNIQKQISYITGVISAAIAINKESQAGGHPPISYIITSDYQNKSDNERQVLVYIADFINKHPTLVWPQAFAGNGGPYDYAPFGDGKTDRIVGVIGKIGGDSYVILTNTSDGNITVNLNTDVNGYQVYSTTKGQGTITNNSYTFTPYETVVIARTLIGTSLGPTANCGNPNNLLQNCDFESSVNDFSANSSNWRDVQLDPERNAGPNQYTHDNAIIQTDKGKSLEIGRATGTCALQKTAGGGNNDLFRIFTETRQNTTVGTGSNFHLSFDFKIKSRHTRHNSAPFYIIAGFTNHQNIGKEIGLAYTPHDEVGEVCDSTPYPTDYSCRFGWASSVTGCSDAFTNWKHVTIDFTRSQLCENNSTVDQTCMQDGNRLFVGFGITNDYDTLVDIDNVVLTGDGISPQPNPNAAATPTTPSGSTTVSVSLELSGIGNNGNANPKTKDRTATVDFYNAQNEKQASQNVTITYERRSGLFKGGLLMNNLPAGPYTIRVKVPNYLRKELPGIIVIPSQNSIEFPPVTLRVGDINNDNVLDLQDLQDLQIINSCLSQVSVLDSCSKIDLNDDGNIDIEDYNLFRDAINRRL